MLFDPCIIKRFVTSKGEREKSSSFIFKNKMQRTKFFLFPTKKYAPLKIKSVYGHTTLNA